MNFKTIFPIFALTVAVLVSGYYLDASLNGDKVQASTISQVEPAAGGGLVSKAENAEKPNEENAQEDATVDVEAVLAERILGDVNAPIRISEHSSLTCPHCAHFHATTFKVVKEKLIDTGKAYLVFSDFPLDANALHAGVIARCLPEDKYFDFLETLFTSQDAWAFDRDYIKSLQMMANEAGLSTAKIKACLGNDKIQEEILARMMANRTQFGINSTPSFVINNKVTISGALDPEVFIQKVEEAAAAE